MLHHIIAVSASGITLFAKEFIKNSTPLDMLGSLITAMQSFAVLRTGLSVTYIEMKSLGVAITQNQFVTIVATVDVTDGADLARLVASEVLRAFMHRYAHELDQARTANAELFAGFGNDVPDIIRHAVRPVLDHLASKRGVVLALLTAGQGNGILYSTQEVDRISVLAHHSRVIDLAAEVAAAKDDFPLALTLKNDKTTVSLCRVERSSLIVVTKNQLKADDCQKEIDDGAALIRKLLIISASLSGQLN